MSTHRLLARQFVARPVDEVFTFFAEPENLRRLTPASMRFEFLTDDRAMRQGLEIDYRLRPLLGIPVGWKTRIDAYDPPRSFQDTQLRGPYSKWEHRHTFEAVDGGTLITDEIEYAVPFGPLGDVVNRLAIRDELRRIFGYRADAIRSAFAEPAAATGRTVAVAGGTGFVGAAIALELHRRGDHVIVLSHRGEEARAGLPDAIEIRKADVQSGEGIADALRGADALVIALAFKNNPIESPRRHQTFMEVDAAGSERLAAAAADAGIQRLVYVSGAGAAPDAERHWFRAKWRAEEAIRATGLTWTIIRPTWIYGPRDVALNRFVGFARRLRMVPMTNFGRQKLAPVFIDDVATLVADALTDDNAANQVFDLGGPEELSMREIIGTALRVAGLRRPIVPGPTPLIKLAALPMTLLPEPLLTPDAVDFINQPATVDNGPLLARMPRRLTPLEAGLRTYLDPKAGETVLAFDRETEGLATRQVSAPGLR
jgi:uncharacterized protein YbjT (DUF2867 family)/ligand-binding SRPBCC domain-containing protein